MANGKKIGIWLMVIGILALLVTQVADIDLSSNKVKVACHIDIGGAGLAGKPYFSSEPSCETEPAGLFTFTTTSLSLTSHDLLVTMRVAGLSVTKDVDVNRWGHKTVSLTKVVNIDNLDKVKFELYDKDENLLGTKEVSL